MKYLLIPLVFLFFCSLINTAYNFQPIGINNYNGQNTFSQNPYDTHFNANGKAQNFTLAGKNFSFGIDLTQGIILILVTAVAIGAVAGVGVLGSGLNATSTMIIFKSSLFFMVWTALTFTGISILLSIPIVGLILWIGLTLVYTLGVAQQIGFSA